MPSGRLARWIMKIQQYDFKIEHIKEVNNVVADVISRNVILLGEGNKNNHEH